MAYFQNPEVSFEVPDDWVDQTAVVYAERVGIGLPSTISLCRNAMPGSDTLQSRASAVSRKLVAELPDAKILEENWLTINTVPAVQLLVEWKHHAGALTQLITLFVRDGTFWSFTATVPSDRLGAIDPILQAVLSSLQVTKPQQPLELVIPVRDT